MSDNYVNVPKIAKETSIPESTVRRYLEQHNHTLRTKKSGRGAWLLHQEDLSLIREIRACYERKMSFDEVEEHLLQSGQPLTVTIDDEQEQVITPANAFMQLAGEVQRLQEEVTSSRKELASAHEEIRELKKAQETNAEQQKEANEKQKESMDAIAEEMQFVTDGITRLERERQKRAEKSFWQRLFGP